jgi:hypothetical protein
MTTLNPITPPPELVQQWMNEICDDPDGDPHFVSSDDRALATRAAQWGADQQLKLDAEQIGKAYQAGADHELEACCEWLAKYRRPTLAADLKFVRRPKPPSLKEQALAVLTQYMTGKTILTKDSVEIIRRALEALPDD